MCSVAVDKERELTVGIDVIVKVDEVLIGLDEGLVERSRQETCLGSATGESELCVSAFTKGD